MAIYHNLSPMPGDGIDRRLRESCGNCRHGPLRPGRALVCRKTMSLPPLRQWCNQWTQRG